MILQKKLERRRRRREESAQGARGGPAGDAPDEDISREKEQVCYLENVLLWFKLMATILHPQCQHLLYNPLM